MMRRRLITLIVGVVAIAALTGCSAMEKSTTTDATDLERELKTKTEQVSELEGSVKDYEMKLAKKETELARQQADLKAAEAKAAEYASSASSTRDSKSASRDVNTALPKASVGECFAKVWVPPVYKTETEQMLKSEASERLEIIPAKYEWVEEKVLVKGESKKLVNVPAVYETVTEKVLDTPAHTVWKKGRGPIEKVDNATGEIMCLVEVPASYKTVSKRVVKTAATTREVSVPAEYKTVKVRKMISEEQVKRIPVEAEYTTITRRVKVTDGVMEWRPVLCETNMSSNVISGVQRALAKAGHNPGPIDGVYGSKTRAALRSYQKAKGLAIGGLTMKTLESLGVRMGS